MLVSRNFTMNTKKSLMVITAMTIMAGSGGAFVQQQPAHSAAGEKLAAKTTAPMIGHDANLTFDTTPQSRPT